MLQNKQIHSGETGLSRTGRPRARSAPASGGWLPLRSLAALILLCTASALRAQAPADAEDRSPTELAPGASAGPSVAVPYAGPTPGEQALPAPPEAGGVPEAEPATGYEPLAAFIETGMELWRVPGAAAAVVSSDAVLFQRGFGETAIDGQAVNEHTLFAIASTTKAMIAAGILMLADEGRLSLDDRVVRHVPELHFRNPLLTEQVTLRDLLTHRTGLPSTDFWTFFQEMPLAEQIERLEAVTSRAGLRERLIYQNTMYELAGLVIERVSGKRWDDLLTEWLWHPIGMFETYGSRGRITAGRSRVTPHYALNDQVSEADWDLPADQADAAGSVWSSLHDMSLWAQFLLRGGTTAGGRRLISAAHFAEMFEPQQLIGADDYYPTAELTRPQWRSYGLGWFQQDFQGRKIDFHTGSLSGLVAIIGLDRAADRAVVVFGNQDHAEFRHAVLWEVMDPTTGPDRTDWNAAVRELYERLADEREAEWHETRQKRLTNANPGLPPEAYIGSYRSAVNGDIVVGRDERRLQLRTARVTLDLRHWHLDTFLVEYLPWNIREFATFRIGTDGAVAGLEVLGDYFERLDPQTPLPR